LKCCKKGFKLIFMDINMPKMDGIKSSQYILDYCIKNNIRKPKICALTAYDNINTI
jgi:CheY-like chemotaxis protein